MVELDIGEVVLHRALRHVLDGAGEPPEHLVVRDHRGEPCDVLVVHIDPWSCVDAVSAVRTGEARGLLCADAPDDLPGLLARLDGAWCAIPARVLATAALATAITPRQTAIVRALASGHPLDEAAAVLGVSAATLKRDLRRLRAELGVIDRAGIVARARELGL